MRIINYLKAKRKFNMLKQSDIDMRVSIVTASIYNYEYYHGTINATIYKSNDKWLVAFNYTPVFLNIQLKPTIGSFKITDKTNDFGSILNRIFDLTRDNFTKHLHNYWKRINGVAVVSLSVRPKNIL